MSVSTLAWRDAAVVLLDQTRLPAEEVEVTCRSVGELVDAIRRLAVRGAPLLGLAGAYGVALAVEDSRGDPTLLRALADRLATARPTAVNLALGVSRALAAVEAGGSAVDAADEMAREDRAASEAMAAHGQAFVPDGARVLTHCNTGRLVSAGEGTAFAVVLEAHRAGRLRHLWVDETRPLLQGARLTAWEARQAGIPHSVLVDGAAGSLFAHGEVDVVLVGADRICADGSVANKVGTYPLAVLAKAHGVPFVVVAPTTTIDASAPTGADVVVEQRAGDEVTTSSDAYNPAFDVTPPELVTAIVTENGPL